MARKATATAPGAAGVGTPQATDSKESKNSQSTSARARRTAAADQVSSSAGALAQASVGLRERDRAWREGLDTTETGLLVDRGVPAWTIKAHARVGHLGGAALFALIAIVAVPVLVITAWQMLVVFGVRIVNDVPALVLRELDVNATIVSTRTDSFVFSWVMPVLFFVLIFAGLTLWIMRIVARAVGGYGRRLALGLFAGYGTGLRTDFVAMSIARSQRRRARSDTAARVARVRDDVEDQ